MSEIRFNRWSHQSGTGGIYQDSSGNIGIGTSVPTSVLDIQGGSIKIGNDLLTSSGVSTFTSGLNVTSGGLEVTGVSTFSSDISIADSIVHTGDINTAIRFPANDTFAVETGGSERLRINPSGKVGIGSAIPTEILDVSGTGDMKMVVHTEDSGAGNNAGIRIATGDGYKWLLQVGDSTTAGGLRIYQETSGSNGERLRIDSSGLVGINQTSPQRHLHVKSGANNNDGAFRIESSTNNIMDMGTDGTGHFLNCVNADPFRIKFAGSEKFRFLSGGGITFNGDTATANALDDYEEGTWTFTITPGGGSYSYGYGQTGYYRKIGSLVFINAWIHLSIASAVSGGITLSGLPYNCHSTSRNWIPVGGYNHGGPPLASSGLWMILTNGASTASFLYNDDQYGSPGTLTAGNLPQSSELYINGCYISA